MVAPPALHPAEGDRGISWAGTARHSLVERQHYHRQAAMGLLKERGLVESVQEIAGNKNHGRVLGRCFCGGGRFHSRWVMRPVKIRITVLILAVP